MQNSNYIILIDENGQPYIAHSVWGRVRSGAQSAYGSARSAAGRGTRAVHKYLLKIGEGAKAQYAYTKEEVDRLMGRGRQKVQQTIDNTKNAARDAIGITARDKRDQAHAALTNARAQDRAAMELYDINSKKEQQARRDAQIADINAKGAVKTQRTIDRQLLNTVNAYNKAIDSKNNYETAQQQTADAERAARIAEINYGGASKTAREREKLAREAMDKYVEDDKSTLKKVQRALRKGEQNAHAEDYEKAVKLNSEAADSALDKSRAATQLQTAKNKAANAQENEAKAKKAYEEAGGDSTDALWDHATELYNRDLKALGDRYDTTETAREAHQREDEAREATKDAARRFTGESGLGMNDRYYSDTQRAYDRAEAEYADTPLAKLDDLMTTGRRAANSVRNSVIDAADGVQSVAASAKAKASEVKEITASQARQLQAKLASGKELAQNELNQLMTFLMKGYK